jgi:hypothetical protein
LATRSPESGSTAQSPSPKRLKTALSIFRGGKRFGLFRRVFPPCHKRQKSAVQAGSNGGKRRLKVGNFKPDKRTFQDGSKPPNIML